MQHDDGEVSSQDIHHESEQVEAQKRCQRECNIPFVLASEYTYLYDVITGDLFVVLALPTHDMLASKNCS